MCTCTSTAAVSVVLTAVFTALLATVIFAAVLVAVYKYQLNPTHGTGNLAGEEQVYEQMDVDEGGVPVRGGDVGEQKDSPFQLKDNEAYDPHKYQLNPSNGTGNLAGREQVYEQMDVDKGGVPVRGGDVGERKDSPFQLKDNEAYAPHSYS